VKILILSLWQRPDRDNFGAVFIYIANAIPNGYARQSVRKRINTVINGFYHYVYIKSGLLGFLRL
jgi:hypothetical protein